MIRAVCIGECMVELRPAVDGLYARSFAGDAFNTAAYLARALGDAEETAFLTVLGDDPFSDEMQAAFRAQGVSDRLVWRTAGRSPGLYVIELDARGERTFHYWRGASAARGWLRELEARGGVEVLAGVDLVYLSGITLAILDPAERDRALVLLESLRGRVGRIAFDPNVRLRLWADASSAAAAVARAVRVSDVVLPSTQDADLLWGEGDPRAALRRWRAMGAAEVALTRAADGASVAWSDGEAHIPAPPAGVADTSGAGDSFNGAYLAARLRGADPVAAAQAGVTLASRVVAHAGALIPRQN